MGAMAKGVSYIEEYISNADVGDITEYIPKLKDDNKMSPCKQCEGTLAYNSVYEKDELLNRLGETLKESIEQILDKELIYSYTYARYYPEGAELTPHVDRETCEFTVSMTLGSSNDDQNWPLHFKQDDGTIQEAPMKKGDICIMKGVKNYHWRNKNPKEWQLQLFVHYNDKNGLFADKIEQVREQSPYQDLRLVGSAHGQNLRELTKSGDCWVFSGLDGVGGDICAFYQKMWRNHPDLVPGEVGGRDISGIDKDIRNVMKMELPVHNGIGGILAASIYSANAQAWEYDVSFTSQVEYLVYRVGGKYDCHKDTAMEFPKTLPNPNNKPYPIVRKLTAITVLNDDFEGGKFFIQTELGMEYPPQKKGDIIVFPSTTHHGCEPVTKGERHAVVAWVDGPRIR